MANKIINGTGLEALMRKIKSLFFAKQDSVEVTELSIDSTPTEDSTNLVTSGGVYSALFSHNSLLIQSEGDATVSEYAVPSLTAEQVQQAYNAVVAGRGCIIVDHDEKMHAYVNQADALNDEISIAILFYSTLILTYTLSNGAVTITSVEL